jgi:NAD(P)-dependent dehydrogenase (short-subunit alcohol dehydrogenase family)
MGTLRWGIVAEMKADDGAPPRQFSEVDHSPHGPHERRNIHVGERDLRLDVALRKIVFSSSMGGIFTPAVSGSYVSTKDALESIAEAMQQEMAPFGIKMQTVNPSAYLTGHNKTMPDDVL